MPEVPTVHRRGVLMPPYAGLDHPRVCSECGADLDPAIETEDKDGWQQTIWMCPNRALDFHSLPNLEDEDDGTWNVSPLHQTLTVPYGDLVDPV